MDHIGRPEGPVPGGLCTTADTSAQTHGHSHTDTRHRHTGTETETKTQRHTKNTDTEQTQTHTDTHVVTSKPKHARTYARTHEITHTLCMPQSFTVLNSERDPVASCTV